MTFYDKSQEARYLVQQWRDNRNVIRLFAFLIFLHSLYLLLIYYYYDVTFTPLLIVLQYGIYLPFSVLVLFLAVVGPMRHAWTRRLWYVSISIVSVMMGTGIAFRNLLCHYGRVNRTHCDSDSRPIGNAEYALIYVFLGPLLVLNIFRNDLRYQMVAIAIMIPMVIWSLSVTQKHELLLWFSFVFIVGAQVMGIIVERTRSRLERERFIGEINNKKLSNHLQREVKEKTKAQEKAKEEEDKRTQFTNMLFHEMRVPLNSVILSMNDLETENVERSLGPDAAENVQRINSGLNAIIGIINDSLDFRKMNEGKLQIVAKPFDYHMMLTTLLKSMESSWKNKGIRFHRDFDPAIDDIGYKLLGDENRLRQVVANYISNAVKFTPTGGRIDLRTVLEEQSDGYVWIATKVVDNGVGIRKEDQKKLFKPFVQIDPDKLQGGKGSGLGLSIVSSIVTSMEGSYGVNSEYGKGSEFWFKVKMGVTDIPGTVSLELSKTAELTPFSRKYRILVTDDDGATRKIMKKLLEKLGHSVDVAEDGLECIEMVVESFDVARRGQHEGQEEGKQHPYDVLFLDNQMPRLNGLDTIKLLRRDNYNIPIILLTGSSDTQTIQQLKEAGANDVLLKPATMQMIHDTLRKLSVVEWDEENGER